MNKLKTKKRLETALDQLEVQKDNIQTIKMSASPKNSQFLW